MRTLVARVLQATGDDAPERRNFLWLTAAFIVYGASLALFTGELWTGYLTATGFSDQQLGIITSAGQFAQALGLLAFMGLADRIQRRVRAYVICVLVVALAPVLFAGIALVPRAALPLSSLLYLLVGVLIAQQLVHSIPVMVDYPVMARAVTVGVRGKLFGITSTAFTALPLGVGAASAIVLRDVSYPRSYSYLFLVGAAAMALRAAAYSRVRELPDLAIPGKSRSALPFTAIVDVFRLKEFQWLAGPHVARGLALSIATVFALRMGLEYLGLPKHYPGYATAANSAAGILAGLAIAAVADRWGAGLTTLVGDTLYGVAVACLIVIPHPLVFLGLYFLLHFGRYIEDTSVPLGAINIVPPEHLGAFSSARLMILYGSNAVGLAMFGGLFERFSAPLVLGIVGVMKILTGVWFWYVFRLKPPVVLHLTAAAEAPVGDPAEGEPPAP